MSDVTQIMNAIQQGDPHAAEQLLPLVYDELRRLAGQKMAHEKPGQTLDATALVHESHAAEQWAAFLDQASPANPSCAGALKRCSRPTVKSARDRTIFGANTDFIPGLFFGNYFAPFNSFAVTSDGTIVVAGTITDNPSNATYTKIGVVELTKDGRLNDHFGQGGKVLVNFGTTLVNASFTNFVVNPNGSILVGATTNNSAQTIYDFSVAELNKDGSLNADFGTGGETIVDFGPGNSALLSYAIVQPDGTIVLAGSAANAAAGVDSWAVAELSGKRHDRHHHWWENDD